MGRQPIVGLNQHWFNGVVLTWYSSADVGAVLLGWLSDAWDMSVQDSDALAISALLDNDDAVSSSPPPSSASANTDSKNPSNNLHQQTKQGKHTKF